MTNNNGYGQYSKPWEELEITDNFLFCKIMSEPALCKEMIRRILGITVSNLIFTEKESQFIGTYESRGIRLDVVAYDENNVYDIEFQSVRKAALPKRMRYYQGIMDMDSLTRNSNYENLRDTYIIFICDFDPFKGGEAVYRIRSYTGSYDQISYDDGTHKVFININAYDNIDDIDKDLRSFLKYLKTGNPQDDFTYEIDNTVKYNRQNADWRKQYMTVALEIEYEKREARRIALEEGRIEGYAKGMIEGKAEGIKEGIKEGISQGRSEGWSKGREAGKKAGYDAHSIETALLLVTKYGATPEQAAEDMNLTKTTLKRFQAALKKREKESLAEERNSPVSEQVPPAESSE